MLAGSHLRYIHLSNKRAWKNTAFTDGLLYPDVYLAAPNRVPYATTHLLHYLSNRALLLTAKAYGETAHYFAQGIVTHLRDDVHLERWAKAVSPALSPLVNQIVDYLPPKVAADTPEQLQQALLPAVAAGVLEFSVARIVGPEVINVEQLTANIDDPSIVSFISHIWSLQRGDVKYINERWRDYLSEFWQGDAEDIAWAQVLNLWPRYAARQLRAAGLVINREAVVVSKQLRSHHGEVAGLLYKASQHYNDLPLAG